MQPTDAGNYTVVVTNAAGSVTSAVATLTVWVPPAITGQPQSRTNLAGTTATFSVTATGDAPLNYQWRKNGANLVNGGDVSGANSTTLSLASVQPGDAANYQVVVTNAAGSATSAVARLTVWVPPAITGQPQSRTNLAGTTATFSVTATGDAPLNYQWRKNGANQVNAGNVSGANSTTLSLASVQPGDAANYQVVVVNAAGSATSAVATLVVWVPPTITGQPQSRTAFEGANVTFTVAASGTAPLGYQWFFGTIPIAAATNASLTLMNVQPSHAGSYRVAVSNVAGSTSSEVAWLYVQYYRQYELANTNEIRIRDLNTALPYPSSITVTGLNGTVSKTGVTFSRLTHTWAGDIDAMVVGPQGQKALLMSDAGEYSVYDATFTFDDAAAEPLPEADWLVSGTYRPTDYAGYDATNDIFAVPAPAGPYGAALAAFNSTDPNGTWSLFVRDDAPKDSGRMANGWRLSLTVLHLATGDLPAAPYLSVSQASRLPDGRFQFVVTGEPGRSVEIWTSDDLASWTLLGTFTNTEGSVTITDASTSLTRRFYRARGRP